MALVAPGCVRFALNGTIFGTRPWTNIWDVDILGDISNPRDEIAVAYAATIYDVWEGSIGLSVSEDVVLTDIGYVDLDSELGTSGNVPPPGGEPVAGAQTGEPSPANVSVLVTKQTASVRGDRNGRMYVPGLPEADAGGLDLTGGALDVFADRCEAFLTNLTNPVEISPAVAQPVVIHTRNIGTPTAPNIVYSSHTPITALVPQARLATQRRRLRS